MGEMDGIEATRCITAAHPDTNGDPGVDVRRPTSCPPAPARAARWPTSTRTSCRPGSCAASGRPAATRPGSPRLTACPSRACHRSGVLPHARDMLGRGRTDCRASGRRSASEAARAAQLTRVTWPGMVVPAPGADHFERAAEGAHAVAHVDEAVTRDRRATAGSKPAPSSVTSQCSAASSSHTLTTRGGARHRRACRRSAAPPCSRSRRPPRPLRSDRPTVDVGGGRQRRPRRRRRAAPRRDRPTSAAAGRCRGPASAARRSRPADRLRISSIIASASAGSSSTASLARRSLTASATRCCCAPSCRLRSSLRRSASPAATMRARDCCSSSLRVAQLVERCLQRSVELDVVQGEADLAGQLGEHAVVVFGERLAVGAAARRR